MLCHLYILYRREALVFDHCDMFKLHMLTCDIAPLPRCEPLFAPSPDSVQTAPRVSQYDSLSTCRVSSSRSLVKPLTCLNEV